MTVWGLMVKHKSSGPFISENLTETSDFLSVSPLNRIFSVTYLHLVSINRFNIRQFNTPYSKFNITYNYCEEPCVENVRFGGLTRND
jgi:hypothetical protein